MNKSLRKNERGFSIIEIVLSVAMLGAVTVGIVNIIGQVVENSQSNMLAKQVIELQDAATRCYAVAQADGGCAVADGDGWDLGAWNSPNHVDAAGAVNPVLRFLVSNLADVEVDTDLNQWNQWDISRINADNLIFMHELDNLKFAMRTMRKFSDNRLITDRPYEVGLSVLAKGSNLLYSSFERSDIVSTDSGAPSVKSGGLDRAYDQEYIDIEVSPVLAIRQGAPAGAGTDVDEIVADIIALEAAKLAPNTEILRTYVTTVPYKAPSSTPTPPCRRRADGECTGSGSNK